MRYILKVIVVSFICLQFAQALTLDDIEQLKKLKDQLEQSGKLSEEDKEKLTQIKSLETFKDQVTQPPPSIRADSLIQVKPEQTPTSEMETPQKLQLFGFDIFKNAKDHQPCRPDFYTGCWIGADCGFVHASGQIQTDGHHEQILFFHHLKKSLSGCISR